MKKIFLIIFAFIFSLQPGYAEVPKKITPEDVQRMVGNINLPKDQVGSLKLDMHMNLSSAMRILVQLRYAKPDNYSLMVFDDHDKTPIMIVTGKKALVNDPLAESMTLVASAGVAFELKPQGDQYNANFAFNMPLAGKINNRVDLDFKTLFSRVCIDVEVNQSQNEHVRFYGKTAQKSSCEAFFDATEPFALKSMAIRVEGHSDPVIQFPVIQFPVIEVGKNIPNRVFAFPIDELRKSGLKFSEIEPDGMIDTMMVVASVMRGIFSRAAIRSVELREQIETSLKFSPDWEKMTRVDAERSKLLKKIFFPMQ
jgi:hypothetical protein